MMQRINDMQVMIMGVGDLVRQAIATSQPSFLIPTLGCQRLFCTAQAL